MSMFNRIVAIPYIMCGASLIIGGFLDYQNADDFWNKAISTTGTIVKTRFKDTGASGGRSFHSDHGKPFTISTIQFITPQGDTIEFEGDYDMCVDHQDSSPCQGKEVEIVYDQSNPHQVIVRGSLSPVDQVRRRMGFGMFTMFVGVLFFNSER